jgi:crossover junction endodeoxyribonuclease RuvC
MTTIIGIDPGSRITGYGIIHVTGNQSRYVASGCLPLSGETPAARLQEIFSKLTDIVHRYQPQEAAIEQVFMHVNVSSALKLGQARGAAIVALGILPVAEYSARQVKQAIVGYGAAKKEQIQHMVQCLLNLPNKLQADEADALAIALCHAHTRTNLGALTTITKQAKRTGKSWRQYQPT